MRQQAMLLCSLLFFAATACSSSLLLPTPAPGTYQPGELLVQFQDDTAPSKARDLLHELGILPREEVISGVWRVGVPPGQEAGWLTRLLANPLVRHAEFNRYLHRQMVGNFRPYRVWPAQRHPAFRITLLPDDPRFREDSNGLPAQWGAYRVGLPQAWDATTGQGIKVAILDTGIDAEHPDLRDNLEPGRNFVEGEPASPVDDFGHGTHVAGIVAAAMNSYGIVGTAPRARLIPVRVLGINGGTTSALLEGLSYAVKQGARVINLSLGSARASRIETEQLAKILAQNVVIVAAAGNSALDGNPLEYPAAIAGVIAVTATRPPYEGMGVRGEHADFSNFNPFVTVAAPGVDILSTVPRRFSAAGDQAIGNSGAYAYASGTSMASPLVAGLVALMLARHPEWSAAQLRSKLISSATDLGEPGFDDFFGWGLVNAPAAIQ
ncbi:MAG: S8 family serine peptidase [Cyanobacteria bacterium NC_groundwater_1444_Ag_S-0.65um_54_12]|nr:S8 family serine peptidase [Cyanobacteria bacterium NC_groundwater_1444_Ag_S-0.65um_54_12]